MYSMCLDNLEKKEVVQLLVQSCKRATQRCPCGYLTDPAHECSCSPIAIKQYCRLDEDGERILKRSMEAFGFSARAYHRILKVARTIADLDGEDDILARHISEAVQYRTLDRNLWIK